MSSGPPSLPEDPAAGQCRSLTPADIPAAQKLLEYLFEHLDSPRDPDFRLIADAAGVYARALRLGYHAPTKREWGFFMADRLVALALGRLEERPILEQKRLLFLDAVVVDPAWQQKGVLREFMARLEELCRGEGLEYLELRVLESNREALAAWPRLGFQPHYIRFRKKI